MATLALGACSLFIVFSVFNGLKTLITNVHQTFDPEIQITIKEGKVFEFTPELKTLISQIEGVADYAEIILDDGFANHGDVQKVIRIKGVPDDYNDFKSLDSSIVYGNFTMRDEHRNYVVLGKGVQYELNINIDDEYTPMQVWYPNRYKEVLKQSENYFNSIHVYPVGIFEIERQYDDNFIFIPISKARELIGYNAEEVNAIEIKTKEGYNTSLIINQLQHHLSGKFDVKNSEQIHSGLYKALMTERFFVFLIFVIILIIAGLNLFLSITLIIISKRKDIAILIAMGCEQKTIRLIFLTEGLLIGFVGTILGLGLGLLICYLQEQYGFYGMNIESSISEAFPVKIVWADFFLTGTTTILVSGLISLFPALKSSNITIKDQL